MREGTGWACSRATVLPQAWSRVVWRNSLLLSLPWLLKFSFLCWESLNYTSITSKTSAIKDTTTLTLRDKAEEERRKRSKPFTWACLYYEWFLKPISHREDKKDGTSASYSAFSTYFPNSRERFHFTNQETKSQSWLAISRCEVGKEIFSSICYTKFLLQKFLEWVYEWINGPLLHYYWLMINTNCPNVNNCGI